MKTRCHKHARHNRKSKCKSKGKGKRKRTHRLRGNCKCGCGGNGCNNPACTCACGRCGGQQTHHRRRLTGGSTHVARAKHVTVSYTMDSSADSISIHAKFGDLTGVSAIHIHTNNNGKPGPIIAWLATTSEWKSGVLQNTPGKNAPCCGPNNPMCCLAGPADSTPLVKTVANTEMDYVVKNEFCKASTAAANKCPWINNGTILVIHGLNFQRVANGCITDGPVGIDVLQAIPFAADSK